MMRTCMLAVAMTAFLCLAPAGGALAKPNSLIVACRNDDYGKVKELVESGYDVNERDQDGASPLMEAVTNGNENIIFLLLKSHADANAKNNNGVPIMNFVFISEDKVKRMRIMKALFENGADVKHSGENIITPLMYASMDGQIESINFLLDKESNINAKDSQGRTALMHASSNGHAKAVEILLDRGADVNAEDRRGHTALSLATEKGHKEVAEFLKSRGGVPGEPTEPSAAEKAEATAKDEAATERIRKSWSEFRDRSPMDDSLHYRALLRASDDSDVFLVLRCRENKSEAIITADKYMGLDDAAVEWRFDSEKALKRRWSVSTSRKAVFAPKPIEFMKKLEQSQKLAVRLFPYGDNPVTAVFELEGVENVVESVSQVCRWKRRSSGDR